MARGSCRIVMTGLFISEGGEEVGSKGSLTPGQQAKVSSVKCLLALCETGDPLPSAGRPDCSCWAHTLDFPPNWTNSHINMEW